MAFTVTFPTAGPLPRPDEVAAWLTEQGEPFDEEGPGSLALKALPVRLRVSPDDGAMHAHLEVGTSTPLVRLVDLLFALSVRAGADVRLTGSGEMTRSRLWMRLADEQDRVRIAEALRQAEDRGNREEALQKLWTVLAVIWPGRDLRWDAAHNRIVEMKEVDEPGGISVEEASWLVEGAASGDVIPVPIESYLHLIAWRWLTDAYPSLTSD